jgi:hypothetical protein
MEMQVPDLSSLGRQQTPSVPLFMLKMEALKMAVEAYKVSDWATTSDLTNLADNFVVYVMSPGVPEAHDDAPASLVEDF